MCADGRRTLSVAFVPHWGAGNPYRDALAWHLSGCGVDLDTVRFLKDLFHCGVCSSSTLDLAIDWQVTDPTVSEKDQAAPYLRSIERDFVFEGRLP